MIPAMLADMQAGLAPSPEESIERLVGQMALLFPAGKLSQAETDARLDLYIDLLHDIPFDVLATAFKRVAQISKFFPTVAEIREAATPALRARRNKVNALKALAQKHRLDGEVERPDRPLTLAEIAEANEAFQRLGIRTRYADDGTAYQIEPPAQDADGNEITGQDDEKAKAA